MSAAGLVAGLPRKAITQGLSVMMVVAIFAAVAGPVVHHHFAELLPWHSHQFTSEKTLTEHSHIYGAHVHSEGQILDGTVSLVSEEGGNLLGFSLWLVIAVFLFMPRELPTRFVQVFRRIKTVICSPKPRPPQLGLNSAS